jgi:hypothetical protein
VLLGGRVILLVINAVALTVLGPLRAQLLGGADVAVPRGIGFAALGVRLAALE